MAPSKSGLEEALEGIVFTNNRFRASGWCQRTVPGLIINHNLHLLPLMVLDSESHLCALKGLGVHQATLHCAESLPDLLLSKLAPP